MAVNQSRGSSGTKSSSRGRFSGRTRRARRSFTDHQEIDWQFDVAEVEPVESWLGHHFSGSDLVVAPDSTEAITDTYYDTEDWRFYRAGYALRVRKTGGEVESSERCAREATGLRPIVLGSEAFRDLLKGKGRKHFEKVMEDARKSQNKAGAAGKVVR